MMKPFKFCTFIFLGIVGVSCINRNTAPEKSDSDFLDVVPTTVETVEERAADEDVFDDQEALRMLNEFYRTYLMLLLNNDLEHDNYPVVVELRKRYSTSRLTNRIAQDGGLDFDPYTNSQDYFDNWLKSLKIEKDELVPCVFNVSFRCWEEEERPIKIMLYVRLEDGEYKIDDIFNRSVYK